MPTAIRKVIPALALAAVLVAPTHAQPAAAPPATATDGAATPEALLTELYAIISGPAGAPRDWTRFRALCLPDARLIAVHIRPDGSTQTRAYSVDAFVAAATKATSAEGFYETGRIGQVARFDRIATVVSPYESRHAPGAPAFARGVNHFQLVEDAGRWRVVDIFWQDDQAAPSRPGEPTAPSRR